MSDAEKVVGISEEVKESLFTGEDVFESGVTKQSEFARLSDSQIKDRINKMFKAWMDTMGKDEFFKKKK